MDLMLQGLTLSLTGIVITFASLGLFILIIVLLQRFFGVQETRVHDAQSDAPAQPDRTNQKVDPEVAAAIAIAVAHFRSLESSATELGSTLIQGPGPWWQARQFPTAPQRKEK